MKKEYVKRNRVAIIIKEKCGFRVVELFRRPNPLGGYYEDVVDGSDLFYTTLRGAERRAKKFIDEV